MAILIRLPAKSLIKFRCMSKMWSSIIRSQGFIDSFFSMSMTRSRFIVALSNDVCVKSKRRRVLFFSFSHEGDKSCSCSSLVGNFDMALADNFASYAGACDSINGILAVKAQDGMMICNPSTEQVIKLPVTSRFVGYDPIDDQYKALSLHSTNLKSRIVHLEHKVLTLGRGERWRPIQGLTAPYSTISVGVSINGFIYYGAYSPHRPMNPGIVCFDVRSEKLSYIKAPSAVLCYGGDSILIEYKGKLASIVRFPFARFQKFELWILEDVHKHEWSKQTCDFPLSLWDFVGGIKMSFPGTNKAGEIIMAPQLLSRHVQPFYIFYYNVETKNITRVRLLGIGDDEEFRRCYGFIDNGECHVRIAPQHVDSIAFL